jgi:hypothetical protein
MVDHLSFPQVENDRLMDAAGDGDIVGMKTALLAGATVNFALQVPCLNAFVCEVLPLSILRLVGQRRMRP